MHMAKSRNKKALVETDAAFYAQVRDVFVQARQFVHKTTNFAMVKAYWLVGKMIVEKQGGEAKAAYGDGLIVLPNYHTLCDEFKMFTCCVNNWSESFQISSATRCLCTTSESSPPSTSCTCRANRNSSQNFAANAPQSKTHNLSRSWIPAKSVASRRHRFVWVEGREVWYNMRMESKAECARMMTRLSSVIRTRPSECDACLATDVAGCVDVRLQRL